MKIWKTNISAKFLILLLLLQIKLFNILGFILKAFMKAWNILQISIENQSFV